LALAVILPLATAGLSPKGFAQEAAEIKRMLNKSLPGKVSAPAKKISEVQQKLAQHYVVPLDEKTLRTMRSKACFQALKDPYTAYMSAEELARIESDIKGP